MRILRMDLARLVSSGNMKTIAFFDVEVDDRIRLYGMKLIEAPSGKRVSYAPSSGGVRLATFDPNLSAAIPELAETEYKGRAIAKNLESRAA